MPVPWLVPEQTPVQVESRFAAEAPVRRARRAAAQPAVPVVAAVPATLGPAAVVAAPAAEPGGYGEQR